MLFSHVRLFATLRTVAHQAPQSVGLSRQEYWSGLPCPPPGDFPKAGIEPCLLGPALSGGFFIINATWEAHHVYLLYIWEMPWKTEQMSV